LRWCGFDSDTHTGQHAEKYANADIERIANRAAHAKWQRLVLLRSRAIHRYLPELQSFGSGCLSQYLLHDGP
jgi:hypothetical protein